MRSKRSKRQDTNSELATRNGSELILGFPNGEWKALLHHMSVHGKNAELDGVPARLKWLYADVKLLRIVGGYQRVAEVHTLAIGINNRDGGIARLQAFVEPKLNLTGGSKQRGPGGRHRLYEISVGGGRYRYQQEQAKHPYDAAAH